MTAPHDATPAPEAAVQDAAGGFLWRLMLTTAAGVGLFMSYPRWDLFPLAFVALVPLMHVLERVHRARDAFRWAWWTGFVTNAGGFYWIVGMLEEFAHLPLWGALPIHLLLIAQQALVLGLAGAMAHGLRRRRVPLLWSWVPAVVAAEMLVPLIFPWFIGNSQAAFLLFTQAADLGGVLLLTGLVVCVNVGVLLIVRGALHARGRPGFARLEWRTLFMVAVLFAGNLTYGAVRIAETDRRSAAAETLRIGVVQANIGIREKEDPERMRNNLLLHQHHSANLAAAGAELIIWPETAYQERQYVQVLEEVDSLAEAMTRRRVGWRLERNVTWIPPSTAPLVEDWRVDEATGLGVEDRAPAHRGFDVPLLTGVVTTETFPPGSRPHLPPYGDHPRGWEAFNSALLLDGEGRVLGMADKVKLMPFGEHVPLARFLYRSTGVNLINILPGVSDFSAGQEVRVLPLPQDGGEPWRIGILNCYEDILPRFGRMLNTLGPDLLVNLTNDAWFGDTSEPWLHQQLAVFRAIEQRTWLIRSTNTGVSAFIDPVGRVVQHTETFVEETLLMDVPMLRAGRTPYMRLGDWPGVLAMLWIAAIYARTLLRRRGS